MKQKLALLVLYYLRFFARLQLHKNKKMQIIGITGSAGKSSTRDALYSVLQSKFKVKASFKANSESGIPLDILGLEMRTYSVFDWLRVLILAPIKVLSYWPNFDYYIVEMGIDSPLPPKNMSFLLSIIKPQTGILLNAGLNHGFAFDHLVKEKDPKIRRQRITQEIAKEKGKLILSLPKTGLALLNFDDKNVKALTKQTIAPIYSFGSQADCNCQLLDQEIILKNQQVKTRFIFQLKDLQVGEKHKLEIEINNFLLAKHYGYSLAVSILLGLRANLSLSEIKAALEKKLSLPKGRASAIQGKNHSTIIDSSYNASSMKDLIEMIGQIQNQQGRKLALLGDLRELGEQSPLVHQEIANLASKYFDQVFLVGQEMKRYALPILQKNLKNRVSHFDNSLEAGKQIATLLRKNDLILVKGSQNTIFLEEAVKIMMQEPAKARQLLCRQSTWWLNLKRQAATK